MHELRARTRQASPADPPRQLHNRILFDAMMFAGLRRRTSLRCHLEVMLSVAHWHQQSIMSIDSTSAASIDCQHSRRQCRNRDVCNQ